MVENVGIVASEAAESREVRFTSVPLAEDPATLEDSKRVNTLCENL